MLRTAGAAGRALAPALRRAAAARVGRRGRGAASGGDAAEPGSPPFGLWVERCPRRLERVPKEVVDDHTQIFLPMVNDTDRNDFFWHALEAADLRGKTVLDLGTGSGLLALMAARLGARRVVGVEESGDLARVARRNVAANFCEGVVEIVHGLAADLVLDEPADVLVTETLGTWMTCEGIVQYCEDARRRLLKPGAQVIPERGTQYVVLIESEQLERLFWVRGYRGIDLQAVMGLQDTASTLWSKRVGLRPSDLPYRELCEPIPVLSADFSSTPFSALPTAPVEARVRCQEGTAHAVLDFWVVEDAAGRRLSTDPRARRCEPWAYARDVAWGNGLQLVGEEAEEGPDERWAVFAGADLGGDPSGPSMEAASLGQCRVACLHFGYSGFLLAEDGRAYFQTAPREALLDAASHVVARGRSLHVPRAAAGAAAPALPPGLLRVADSEALRVVTTFQAEHRGAQSLVFRA